MKELSIVIPMYNEEAKIFDTLYNLDIQIKNHSIEIIIIDDLSTDNSKKIVKEFIDKTSNKFRLYENNKNHGPSYSISKGLKLAEGEIILILGADCKISDNYINNLISRYRDDKLIALGSLNKNDTDLPLSNWGQYLDDLFNTNNNYIFGGGMSFRKSLIDEYNIFDSGLKWCEDFDFNLRLKQILQRKKGLYSMVDRELIIYADYPTSTKRIATRHYHWGLGRGFLSKKYGLFSIPGNLERLIFVSILIVQFINIISFLLLRHFIIFILISVIFIIAFFMPLFRILMRLVLKRDRKRIGLMDLFIIIYIAYVRLLFGLIGLTIGYLKFENERDSIEN